MVLLISYDLNGRERPSSYAKVKKYIEESSVSSVRPLYSQWLVETQYTPQSWVDALREHAGVDSNDLLFVVEVRKPFAGWLHQDVWEWINARV